VYYYNKNQIIETRDGSGNLKMQVYHAECDQGGSMKGYIDEVVGLRLEHGRVYAHQAERDRRGSVKDYNVVALTDLTDRVLERYYYSPYGQLEVVADAHFFDYDAEADRGGRVKGDVDADDIAAATSGGDCWGDYSGDCRRLDADCDRDIDVDGESAGADERERPADRGGRTSEQERASGPRTCPDGASRTRATGGYNAIVAYANTLSTDTLF